MTGERFVRTREIQTAVRGRETEILGALGIRPNGRGHINCPFPDHDDHTPSWRWDTHKARAYCTCTNGHALSIFDVLGRLEGVDFDAAKIRAAELIGRSDLVHQKGAVGTKTTAASLLEPPANRSVPELPRMYLAHRLGVASDDVPTPATPVAGWSDLEYFDPPAQKGAKPRLVGQYPCTVFATLAPDGRHAHRIYVAPEGRGKADLEGRDPKKSASLAKGTKATGCAVLWGDPHTAAWLLLAEGIETAAAIAFTFRPEIDAGEAYVAAGIAESGVGSFEPWPATKRATVCADRDEAKKKNEPGYAAGKKAARKFARRHRDSLEVAIALPGKPGGKIDFLDVMLRDGAHAVRTAIESAEPAPADQGESADDGNTIYCTGGSIPQNVADAERLLADATSKDPIRGVYQRGGVLVRIARLPVATAADGIRRAAGSLQILTAGPDFLRRRLTEVATWARFDKRSSDWVQIDAPAEVARTLAEIAGMWPNTPTLAGIVEAPTLRPDGTILEQPGFDSDSGIHLDPGSTDFPAIPDRPTKQDAEAALALLLEIIAGFPFVDEASRSVALAMLITPLIRYAVRAAPLTGISAPRMATGKTLLAHLPAYISTGRSPALLAQADDPQEERKRLLALLLEGSAVTVLDNCDRPLKSDALCTALTETTIRDRILGSTRTISVPTATTWIATGNSLHIIGDLSSRTMLCVLDPQCERPEERQFDTDLHVDVPRRRGELAVAALTVVKAFLAAGAPRQNVPTFGRSEGWSRFVREPLVWPGCADPCLSRGALEARDLVGERLGNLLEAWHDAFGDTGQTINAAIQVAATNEGLRNALEDVGEDRGKLNPRKIGNFLSKYEGRIERGYRVDQAGTRFRAVLWSVSLRVNVSFCQRTRENCQKEDITNVSGVEKDGESRNDTSKRRHGNNSHKLSNSHDVGTCAWCHQPIDPGSGYTATSSGEVLHNSCVEPWAG